MFVGLVWLTSNHIFGSGNFWDKSPTWFLKILKVPRFAWTILKFFKNLPGQFISNRPPKHVITSTVYHIISCAWMLHFNAIFIDKVFAKQESFFLIIFEMSQTDLHWERNLKDLSKTSQKDVVFVTSLRHLKYISKKMSFLWRL